MPKSLKQLEALVTNFQNNIFEKTRLKLTLLYLAIIAVILLLFSQFIYFRFSRNIRHVAEERREIWGEERFVFIRDAESQLFTILITVNLGIIIITGALSYFLAGKTLRPIEEALEQEKRFLSDASHELRTPLTILKTNMEVELSKKGLSETVKENLTSNLEEVNHMSALVNNLLLLSRRDSNRAASVSEKLLLTSVLENSIKRMNKYAIPKNVSISFVKTNLKSIKVEGARELLESAFSNVIKNAIDYNKDNGNVTIKGRVLENVVTVEITDTGIGISKEKIPHLFGRFYRVDESRTGTSGVGLGLSIAQAIINDYGGKISIESELKRGTTVTISLPIIKTS